MKAVEVKEEVGVDGGEGGHTAEIWCKNSYFVVIRLGIQKKYYFCTPIGLRVFKEKNTGLNDRIKQLLSSKLTGEFVRFAIVGVVATGIHYGIYWLLMKVMNVNIAYTIGYVVSWFCNLFLSARFTFKESVSVKRGVGFALSHFVNYLLHTLFLNVFLAIGFSAEIATIFVFVIVVPIYFLLVRFVFKSRRFSN